MTTEKLNWNNPTISNYYWFYIDDWKFTPIAGDGNYCHDFLVGIYG